MLTLVIFSGLPGTGKSTLADRLARELGWPLLRIDDMAACMPPEMDRNTFAFWDRAIAALLLLADAQLKLGVNVILDSIFMNYDRFHAREIARQNSARFLPVYTFVSDEVTWKQRVDFRYAASEPSEGVALWEQVQAQQEGFRPWEAGTALFIDTYQSVEENHAAVLAFVTAQDVILEALPEVSFMPGKYH